MKDLSKRIALYPGTFDPITNGHLDIAERAIQIFDHLIIAVAVNPAKQTLFSEQERIKLIEKAVEGLGSFEVTSFSGLTASFAELKGVRAIIRGLRMISDFEYEFQMALMNRKLKPDADTVFLMPSEKYTYLSSSTIKDIARHQGQIDCFVPKAVAEALREKFGGKK
ncbi:MAG: pantetheine-phosphate adenylyltransferase [candidate division Zixibacteria bacterium]|nr:pantetheine-phosphate adenylyltransferase [candidate division Zixibacteria bacterium]